MEKKAPVILHADGRLGETRPLRTELRRRGATVLMAETAEQALQQAELAALELVILDDELGGDQRENLLEQFRSRHPQAELILLSSSAESMSSSIGRGVFFHGLRPVASATLLDLVHQALPGRLEERPLAADRAAPLVLCVDDDRLMLNSIARLLSRHGYRVSTSDDPQRVLESISEIGPDLVMLDVAMPGLDGRELSSRIRSQYRGLFPIVMHSARASSADRWSGFRHGADYYLPKPCEPHQLLDVIDYYSDRLDEKERQFLENRL